MLSDLTVIAAAASSNVSIVNKIVTDMATTMDLFNDTSVIQTVVLNIVQKNISNSFWHRFRISAKQEFLKFPSQWPLSILAL